MTDRGPGRRPSGPRLRSIRARSAAAAALAAAVMFTAGALWMRHEVREQRLQEGAASATRQAAAMGQVGMTASDDAVHDLLPAFFPEVTYEVVDAHGAVRTSSPDLTPYEHRGPLMPPPRELPGDIVLDVAEPVPPVRLGSDAGGRFDNRTLRAVRIQLRAAGGDPAGGPGVGTLAIYVFVTPRSAERAVAALDRVLLAAVPAASAFVALVAWLATRRALRPVELIRARTAQVTATDPRERVAVPGTGDEIAALAATINSTLARLQAAGDAQRRLVADAAHELRTPLTILRSGLEVAEAYPDHADWPSVVATASAQARRLSTLADDLLLLARIDAGTAPDGTVEPLDLTELTGRLVAETPAPAGVTVGCHPAGPVPIHASRPRVERILRNLLDNAVRHAGTEVEAAVSAAGGHAYVDIRDDGPGIAPADRERIFERFTRLEEDRHRHTGRGTGLGLAIARELAAESHGGLGVLDTRRPGATFRLTLPVDPGPPPR